jgi:hypothetical protein
VIERLERRQYMTAGQIDTTFGHSGRVLTDFPGINTTIEHLAASEPVRY